jgi:ribosomal 30S subunit maturation factor RimM
LVDETGTRLGVVRGRANLPTDALLVEDFAGQETILPLEGPLAARIELDQQRVVVDQETWQGMRA